ncbi:MAG: hypothetical protein JNL01_16625 [Bdellovibrionales bacterium]|nr:hypothetical protein [Bdellovibrionales bacterium]
MKRLIVVTAALIGISSSFAADPGTEKILKSQTVVETVSKFEADRNVDCMSPKEKQIHWMCSIDSCGFFLDITCLSRIDSFSSNDRVTRLSIYGYLDQQNLEFKPELNRVTEYKKLERK